MGDGGSEHEQGMRRLGLQVVGRVVAVVLAARELARRPVARVVSRTASRSRARDLVAGGVSRLFRRCSVTSSPGPARGCPWSIAPRIKPWLFLAVQSSCFFLGLSRVPRRAGVVRRARRVDLKAPRREVCPRAQIPLQWVAKRRA